MEFTRELRKTKWPSRVSDSLDCLFNLQLLFSHLNFSIQEQSVAVLQRHQDGKSPAVRCHFLQKQSGLHPQVPEHLQILLLLPLHESQLGHLPDTQTQFF